MARTSDVTQQKPDEFQDFIHDAYFAAAWERAANVVENYLVIDKASYFRFTGTIRGPGRDWPERVGWDEKGRVFLNACRNLSNKMWESLRGKDPFTLTLSGEAAALESHIPSVGSTIDMASLIAIEEMFQAHIDVLRLHGSFLLHWDLFDTRPVAIPTDALLDAGYVRLLELEVF